MKIAPQTTSRVRTSFDPEFELPRLHQWFAENPHPSRLTLQMYVKELNSLAHRQSRKMLEIHNLCYWFKNARAAYKRAELRMKRQSELQAQQQLVGKHQQSQPQAQDQDDSLQRLPSDGGPPSPSSSPEQETPMDYVHNNGAGQLSSPLATVSEAKRAPRRDHNGAGRVGGALDAGRVRSGGAKRAHSFNQLAKLDGVGGSSDLGFESSSRDSSISPSSTVSLPAVIGANVGAHSHPGPNPANLAQSQRAAGGLVSSMSSNSLNGVELATAVNCLLSTASNQLSSNSVATNNLLQMPPGALRLAASLINSNIITNQLAAAAAAENKLTTQHQQQAAALVDQPGAIRNVLSAFSPISQQFALGFLDNHRLDTKILSQMVFPTSFAVDNFQPPCTSAAVAAAAAAASICPLTSVAGSASSSASGQLVQAMDQLTTAPAAYPSNLTGDLFNGHSMKQARANNIRGGGSSSTRPAHNFQ